jgi:hypothetical protein
LWSRWSGVRVPSATYLKPSEIEGRRPDFGRRRAAARIEGRRAPIAPDSAARGLWIYDDPTVRRRRAHRLDRSWRVLIRTKVVPPFLRTGRADARPHDYETDDHDDQRDAERPVTIAAVHDETGRRPALLETVDRGSHSIPPRRVEAVAEDPPKVLHTSAAAQTSARSSLEEQRPSKTRRKVPQTFGGLPLDRRP